MNVSQMLKSLRRMQKTLPGAFISSVSVVLLVTGAAKIVSAITGGQILEIVDPVVGIEMRQLFWFAGTIEVLVSVVCLFGQCLGLKAALVLWLGANLAVYRIALAWIGGPKSCNCLGSGIGFLNLSASGVDFAMKILLAYMLLGSSATLLWIRKSRIRAAQNAV